MSERNEAFVKTEREALSTNALPAKFPKVQMIRNLDSCCVHEANGINHQIYKRPDLQTTRSSFFYKRSILSRNAKVTKDVHTQLTATTAFCNRYLEKTHEKQRVLRKKTGT